MITRYFAYGSNMNPSRVSARGLDVTRRRGGRIAGLTVVFDKVSREHAGSAHASLAFAPGQHAEGVLLDLAGPLEIRKLDPFERTPVNYSREVVVVETDSGPELAWTYFANPAVRRQGLRPERRYLEHLLAGRPFLSQPYYDWLSRVPCAGEA